MRREEDHIESTGFLDDSVDLSEKFRRELGVSPPKRCSYMTWALHAALITLYSVVFLLATLNNYHRTTNHDALRDMIPSPARSSIRYETKYFTNDKASASVYFGEPSDQREALWEELLGPSTIRLSAHDLERLGRPKEKGIQLPDGDYIGTLNVFHDLHCLRRVTRLLYPEHYFPNITNEDKHMNLLHAQHCMDRLRQSIQCRGDISVATYLWGVRQAVPIGNFTSLHECVNWDALHDWSRDKMVDVFEPGLLIHPTLGPAYASYGTNKTFTGIVVDHPAD
ncbi:hypothetical protein F5B22DRAFT_643821 [Xylaria bambusicola]|uniref:uncharacterized protein n=1 Tax=Xylaria bambusicola TaxID=326684 RepID=UPI002007732D|nr:uncharacterized protein F5B22DRAFT_643821 [Xylaria bambusicola]KAI0521646.1 hypothetical protein F5B22DRAFT_643821 [Xylaria bambusicola]